VSAYLDQLGGELTPVLVADAALYTQTTLQAMPAGAAGCRGCRAHWRR
jgi:hypothetical protein